MITTENRVEQIVGIVVLVLLVVGCYLVLRPFVSALLWAAILCYSTWPLYTRFERRLKGRRTLAAILMTVLVALVLVVPFVLAGFGLADNVRHMAGSIRTALDEGLPDPPRWIASVPLAGNSVDAYWRDLAHNNAHVILVVKRVLAASREWFLRRGWMLGHGIFQLTISVFISFFFYRDGVMVAAKLSDAVKRIAGDRTQHLVGVVGGTVKGVVYGVLGTSLLLGILVGLGSWVAGVPAPLLLGLVTFFLSFVPMGSPLVWVPAGVWLIWTGSVGWGIALLVWCLVVVNITDHILKPYLISRGSNLPFVLVFLGILGGILAFGFIGVFIGPTLLAVGYSIVQEWSADRSAV